MARVIVLRFLLVSIKTAHVLYRDAEDNRSIKDESRGILKLFTFIYHCQNYHETESSRHGSRSQCKEIRQIIDLLATDKSRYFA